MAVAAGHLRPAGILDGRRGSAQERTLAALRHLLATAARSAAAIRPPLPALGMAIWLAGSVAALGWSVAATWAAVSTPWPAARIAIPGTTAIELPAASAVTIWFVSAGPEGEQPWVEVVDPAGQAVPVAYRLARSWYPNLADRGPEVARFTTTAGGTYIVGSDAWRATGTLSIGGDPADEVGRVLAAGAAGAAAFAVAGLVVLLANVRRSSVPSPSALRPSVPRSVPAAT